MEGLAGMSHSPSPSALKLHRVLSPLLYSLCTHDCMAASYSTTIVKFADNTVVIGLAKPINIKSLENWCQINNLLLNIIKTREFIVDPSTKQDRS